MSSTVGTIFYYYETGETPAAKQIYGMRDKPSLPGLPSSLDATSQEDVYSKTARGTIQVPEAAFTFKFAQFDGSMSNYQKFKDLEGSKKRYGIKYPDGGAIEWDGEPYVTRDATGTNSLDTFTVTMFEMSDIDADAAAPANITMVEGV